MGRGGLSFMVAVLGVKEHLKENRVILKLADPLRLNYFPIPSKGPYFFPYGSLLERGGESPWLTFGASHTPPDFNTVP